MKHLASVAVVAAALISTAAGQVCPPPNFGTQPNFNLTSYISARWWIQQCMAIEYLPVSWNHCMWAEYRLKGPNFFDWDIQVHNYAQETDGTPHDTGDTICAKIVDGPNGKLEVSFCLLPTWTAGDYWVIAYNEADGYALLSGGPPTIPGLNGGCRTGTGVNEAGLWILTRRRERNETLIARVRVLAQSAGFDLSVLADVNNTVCTEPP